MTNKWRHAFYTYDTEQERHFKLFTYQIGYFVTNVDSLVFSCKKKNECHLYELMKKESSISVNGIYVD